VCEDAYIWAEHTLRDSPVYEDDCVEVFTSPDPDQLEQYFNVEMNVNAASLEFHHPEGPGSKKAWDPEVRIATTVDGTLNDDSDLDQRWILEVAIPFSAFSGVAKNTPPKAGDVWRLNLNRLGGKTNKQKSQWSPGDPDKSSFHAPQYFGRVTFIK
ncbi:MAG: carbohydrate-binding family 9-like protein, partial [Candidatus Poribacteria bacterium]|nr:carbohydrate-binding family 9-like protein [Candidatus Poribacteria bacterium]